MDGEVGCFPSNRPGRMDRVLWGNRVMPHLSILTKLSRCMGVLQWEFKMPIYISALPEVCRNSARLLAVHCTSAVSDIIRITLAEALLLKPLKEKPAD